MSNIIISGVPYIPISFWVISFRKGVWKTRGNRERLAIMVRGHIETVKHIASAMGT